MNRSITKGFIVLISINLFLVFTGVILPKIISTDKLHITGIVLLISSVFFFVITIYMCLYKNMFTVKDDEISPIRLDEEDFRCLTRGGILMIKNKKNNKLINVILSDIGFDRMAKALALAKAHHEIYRNHIRDL